MASSSPTAVNGRGQLGRFSTGNKFATGNPHASKVQKLRAAMLEAVSESDVKAIIAKLVGLASDGDVKAAKLVLDLVGRPDGDVPAAAPTTPGTPEITTNNFERIKRELLARAN